MISLHVMCIYRWVSITCLFVDKYSSNVCRCVRMLCVSVMCAHSKCICGCVPIPCLFVMCFHPCVSAEMCPFQTYLYVDYMCICDVYPLHVYLGCVTSLYVSVCPLHLYPWECVKPTSICGDVPSQCLSTVVGTPNAYIWMC